jgi:NAD(P)H-hydrate epimerase
MATGGTGDVLTGVITALLCQGLSPFDAARLAVHVHGLAGDLAEEELGQVSMMASDLLDYLPQAFRSVS